MRSMQQQRETTHTTRSTPMHGHAMEDGSTAHPQPQPAPHVAVPSPIEEGWELVPMNGELQQLDASPATQLSSAMSFARMSDETVQQQYPHSSPRPPASSPANSPAPGRQGQAADEVKEPEGLTAHSLEPPCSTPVPRLQVRRCHSQCSVEDKKKLKAKKKNQYAEVDRAALYNAQVPDRIRGPLRRFDPTKEEFGEPVPATEPSPAAAAAAPPEDESKFNNHAAKVDSSLAVPSGTPCSRVLVAIMVQRLQTDVGCAAAAGGRHLAQQEILLGGQVVATIRKDLLALSSFQERDPKTKRKKNRTSSNAAAASATAAAASAGVSPEPHSDSASSHSQATADPTPGTLRKLKTNKANRDFQDFTLREYPRVSVITAAPNAFSTARHFPSQNILTLGGNNPWRCTQQPVGKEDWVCTYFFIYASEADANLPMSFTDLRSLCSEHKFDLRHPHPPCEEKKGYKVQQTLHWKRGSMMAASAEAAEAAASASSSAAAPAAAAASSAAAAGASSSTPVPLPAPHPTWIESHLPPHSYTLPIFARPTKKLSDEEKLKHRTNKLNAKAKKQMQAAAAAAGGEMNGPLSAAPVISGVGAGVRGKPAPKRRASRSQPVTDDDDLTASSNDDEEDEDEEEDEEESKSAAGDGAQQHHRRSSAPAVAEAGNKRPKLTSSVPVLPLSLRPPPLPQLSIQVRGEAALNNGDTATSTAASSAAVSMSDIPAAADFPNAAAPLHPSFYFHNRAASLPPPGLSRMDQPHSLAAQGLPFQSLELNASLAGPFGTHRAPQLQHPQHHQQQHAAPPPFFASAAFSLLSSRSLLSPIPSRSRESSDAAGSFGGLQSPTPNSNAPLGSQSSRTMLPLYAANQHVTMIGRQTAMIAAAASQAIGRVTTDGWTTLQQLDVGAREPPGAHSLDREAGEIWETER